MYRLAQTISMHTQVLSRLRTTLLLLGHAGSESEAAQSQGRTRQLAIPSEIMKKTCECQLGSVTDDEAACLVCLERWCGGVGGVDFAINQPLSGLQSLSDTCIMVAPYYINTIAALSLGCVLLQSTSGGAFHPASYGHARIPQPTPTPWPEVFHATMFANSTSGKLSIVDL